MILLDGRRLVVSYKVRKMIIEALHKSHWGVTITYATARQAYYWPGMKNDIQESVSNCEACTRHQKSKTRPEMQANPPSDSIEPMINMGADLFDLGGSPWIVMVDRFSGYCFVEKLKSTTTVKVTNFMTRVFDTYGWPHSIRTDGGPQFRTEFKKFCRDNSISHEIRVVPLELCGPDPEF